MEKQIKEMQLCPCCMGMHVRQTKQIKESNIINGVKVSYEANYEYCPETDEYYANEQQMRLNDIAQKDAYRLCKGLLTSSDISNIRKKYKISQSDFSELLGWGQKTITRYESFQIQDVAHDEILRKIDNDPKWFLDLLEKAQPNLREEAYSKYRSIGFKLFSEYEESYRKNAIAAEQARYGDGGLSHGNRSINFAKVVDVINYFASSQMVSSLYLVKLMKLLWYSDFLCFKRNGYSITGLAYQCLPMGAVPPGYKQLMELNGVEYKEVPFSDGIGYQFICENEYFPRHLSSEEVDVLDTIIRELGSMSKEEIVKRMHAEDAYKRTNPIDVISYAYANNLSLS